MLVCAFGDLWTETQVCSDMYTYLGVAGLDKFYRKFSLYNIKHEVVTFQSPPPSFVIEPTRVRVTICLRHPGKGV